jgi:hypothetical protein
MLNVSVLANLAGYNKRPQPMEYGSEEEMKIMLMADPESKKSTFSLGGLQLHTSRDEEFGKVA